MKFARVVFLVAGVWGIAALTPLYFLVDLTGRQYAAPTDYPQFFYGFLSVAMAWQIAFLVIGRNPVRYRPLMIAGIVEKLGHVAGVAVLYGQQRVSVADATAAGPDLLLAVLFIAAFAMTPKFRSTAADRPSATGADVVPA
jgi:predicted anti-sigma-YlaC factor YlaD